MPLEPLPSYLTPNQRTSVIGETPPPPPLNSTPSQRITLPTPLQVSQAEPLKRKRSFYFETNTFVFQDPEVQKHATQILRKMLEQEEAELQVTGALPAFYWTLKASADDDDDATNDVWFFRTWWMSSWRIHRRHWRSALKVPRGEPTKSGSRSSRIWWAGNIRLHTNAWERRILETLKVFGSSGGNPIRIHYRLRESRRRLVSASWDAHYSFAPERIISRTYHWQGGCRWTLARETLRWVWLCHPPAQAACVCVTLHSSSTPHPPLRPASPPHPPLPLPPPQPFESPHSSPSFPSRNPHHRRQSSDTHGDTVRPTRRISVHPISTEETSLSEEISIKISIEFICSQISSGFYLF